MPLVGSLSGGVGAYSCGPFVLAVVLPPSSGGLQIYTYTTRKKAATPKAREISCPADEHESTDLISFHHMLNSVPEIIVVATTKLILDSTT
jgi:hypothetical protein